MELTQEQVSVIKGLKLKYEVELIETILYNDIDTIEELSGINGIECIDELIDNTIDIYYWDLTTWAPYNYNYIERALEEFGTSGDWHKDIQTGQYFKLREEIVEEFNQILEALK